MSQSARQKTEMYARITKHGEDLITLFHLDASTDAVKLCKALRSIETVAHRAAEAYCNGEIDGAQWETFEAQTLARVNKLLPAAALEVPVFVNADPRGYALKIQDSYMHQTQARLHRDMGGYGILAPDLNA